MSKLAVVKAHISQLPEVVIVREKSRGPVYRGGELSFNHSLYVTPRLPVYSPEELNAVLSCLMPPGLQPSNRKEFKYVDESTEGIILLDGFREREPNIKYLLFGSLHFVETFDAVEKTCIETGDSSMNEYGFTGGTLMLKKTPQPCSLGININLYPDETVANNPRYEIFTSMSLKLQPAIK